MIACIISGSFLVTVLAICTYASISSHPKPKLTRTTDLAVALTNRNLGQEIHILFIMVLLTITIFFCHSLIRLCMLLLNPPTSQPRPRIPDMTGPEGFQPIVPIRVHLARDVETEHDVERGIVDADLEKEAVPPPPPAYGLWRSSVRVDPNLLHWQRAENTLPTTNPTTLPNLNNITSDNRTSIFTDLSYSRNGSVSGAPPLPTTHTEGPRPPSYASEDGVSYIVEAAPRSTAPRQSMQSHTGVSDIHPAWRPGYAISEITVWPGGRR
jgi:hypothetical protein